MIGSDVDICFVVLGEKRERNLKLREGSTLKVSLKPIVSNGMISKR